MIVKAKHWIKTAKGWVRPGEEFEIDRSGMNGVSDMVEVVNDGIGAEMPQTVMSEPEAPVKKPRGRKKTT